MITSDMKDQIQPNAVCNENRGFYKDNHFKDPLQQQLKYHEKTEADNIDHKQFFKKEPKLSPQSLETISTSTREDSTEISPRTDLSNGSLQATFDPIDINTFKVFPCAQKSYHNHKQCIFYHYPRDRKRLGPISSNQTCEYFKNPGSCPRGDACPKDHSMVEQLYTPDNYKTKFCAHYPNNVDRCEFGVFCSFAHSEDEIKIQLIHKLDQENNEFYMRYYKTVWCPYNLVNHDKTSCVYAHNWQDFRRSHRDFDYEAKACQNWKVSQFVKIYEDGKCSSMYGCRECHGWKELEYHPMMYKTRCCMLKKCLGGRVCPYYHNELDRRDPMKDCEKQIKQANLNENNSFLDLAWSEMKATSEMKSDLEVDKNEQRQTQPLLPILWGLGIEEEKKRCCGVVNDSSKQPKRESNSMSIWAYVPEDTRSLRYISLPLYLPPEDN